jgi:hypothetical protein
MFAIVSAISYFTRSDGYGLPGVQDGIIRAGYPFVIFESGGLSPHSSVLVMAAIEDLFVALCATAVASEIINWLTSTSDRHANR